MKPLGRLHGRISTDPSRSSASHGRMQPSYGAQRRDRRNRSRRSVGTRCPGRWFPVPAGPFAPSSRARAGEAPEARAGIGRRLDDHDAELRLYEWAGRTDGQRSRGDGDSDHSGLPTAARDRERVDVESRGAQGSDPPPILPRPVHPGTEDYARHDRESIAAQPVSNWRALVAAPTRSTSARAIGYAGAGHQNGSSIAATCPGAPSRARRASAQ